MALRTSVSHPLYINAVTIADGHGRIGVTFCPGKYDPHAMTGGWDRDLEADVGAIAAWGAKVVVTLMKPHEFELLRVPALGECVARHGMRWFHLPIFDGGIPDAAFEAQWADAGPAIRAALRGGDDVLVHCRGGLGRAGTIASRLLVEFGVPADDAIARVRAVRPGAVENAIQVGYVRGVPPRAAGEE